MIEEPTIKTEPSRVYPGAMLGAKGPENQINIPLPNYPDWKCVESRGREHHNGYEFQHKDGKPWITFRTNSQVSPEELEQVIRAYQEGRDWGKREAQSEQHKALREFLKNSGLLGPLTEVFKILAMEAHRF
jgi:hypothetical protein